MAKLIQVTKIFHAPVDMVWQLWTDPELVKRWWGPAHFTCPVARIDCRIGGRSIVSMLAPKEMGGQEFFSSWVYTQIQPFQRIEFVQNLCDSNGNSVAPATVGMPPDFPADIETVVVFSQLQKDMTEMTITESAEFGTISHFAQLGLEQSVEKMAAIFPS
jgi:uncharacterized protein YndB with AHSA1/START domain